MVWVKLTPPSVAKRLILSLTFALLTGAPAFAAPVSGLQCRLVPELTKVYLAQHYTYRELTSEIKSRTVDQFIKAIDPSKSLLLETDLPELRKNISKLFETMSSGNCAALDTTYNLLVSRVEASEKFAKELLGPKYKLDESVEFVLYADKRGYPKSDDEQKKLWTALVHFQISNYLLTEKSLEKAKKQLAKRYELSTKRTREQKQNQLITVFSESFARALDPHSSYLSAEDLEDFQINMQLSLEGIGVSLNSEDGYIVVQEIIPGGSADRAQVLKPKDKIIAVGQGNSGPSTNVIDMDLRDVVKLIRGKKGTKVRLTILRQKDKAETLNVTLARDKVDIKEQAAKISYVTKKVGAKDYKIGILDLPSFYGGGDKGGRSCYEDMRKLLIEAQREKIDGLVLDLSRNGGGLLDDAVKISGLFMRKGPVVATMNTQKRRDILADEDDHILYRGPLVILMSRISASASEILAGALRDYNRALIVGGDHSFGKGTVQALQPLPLGLGAMKLTTGMYFLPNGKSTQNQGVPSDIVFPSVFASEDIGEKTLDYPIPPSEIESFATKEPWALNPAQAWIEVEPKIVSELRERSKKRVDASAEFKEIIKDLAESEKNKGPVKLADLRKRSADEKKKTDKENANTPEKRRKLALESPQIKEATAIAADWVSLLKPAALTKTN